MTAAVHAIHYVAGGTVQAGEGVYVERASDATLLQLCREGEFAYVLTTRQMGKSSLMIRTAERLMELGIQPAIVDLTELGANISAEQWYRGFLEKLAEQLELATAVGSWWETHRHLSYAQRFSEFLSDVVIGETTGRVVIFIDEIDTTLRFDFTDDLFGSIRYLYNARATNRELDRLSFVLLGVASPGDLMKDPVRTPFNIGHRVELHDFSEDEAVRFLHPDREVVRTVLAYTNGHPYLTLRVFRSLACQPIDPPNAPGIEGRIASLFFGDQSSKDGNLQFVRDMLTKHASDREAILLRYRKVLRHKTVTDSQTDPICNWLRLSGVVCSKNGFLVERNEIYRRVFSDAWIRENRTVNWTRRALYVAGTIAAIFIGIAAVLGPISYRQWKNAEAARLASQSLLNQSTRPAQIATTALLAMESYQRVPGFDALQALKNDLPLLRKTALSLPHDGSVSAVAYSPDGRWLATASEDGIARVFDAFSGKEVAALRHNCEVNFVVFSPNGRLLGTASDDGTARLFATGTWAKVATYNHPAPVTHVAFSVDGRVATASKDKSARIFNGGSVTVLAHDDAVNVVAFSPDGRLLATGSDDNTARLFEVTAGRQIGAFYHNAPVRFVRFSPDGSLLGTASNDETARIFRVSNNKLLAKLEHQDSVNAIAFSPNGQFVATGSDDRTARLTRIQPRISEERRFLHQGSVNALAFSPNGHLLATASEDGTARVFDVAGGNEVARLAGRDQVGSIAFSPDGSRLATAGDDKVVRVFEIGGGRDVLLLGHAESVNKLAFSPNRNWVATASEDNFTRIFDVQSGAVRLLASEGLVNAVAFSMDSRLVASGGDDQWLRVFEAASGREVIKFAQGWVTDVAFSPDSKWVATASSDRTVKVFDIASGREVVALNRRSPVQAVTFHPDRPLLAIGDAEGLITIVETTKFTEVAHLKHVHQVTSLVFSKDGRRMASGSLDRTARVFEVGTWNQIAQTFHRSVVLSVDFGSPDGRILVTGGGDGMAQVSEVQSGAPLARFPHQSAVRSVAFSPDSRFLGIAAGDTVSITPWTAEDIVRYACSHIPFNLSREDWKAYLPAERYRKTCPLLP